MTLRAKIATLFKILKAVSPIALLNYYNLIKYEKCKHSGELAAYKLKVRKPINSTVLVRGGTSDILVLREILFGEIFNRITTFCPTIDFAIDAGANVGYASLVIYSRYSKAQVVMVEPDENSMGLARLNLQKKIQAGLCFPVLGAVWGDDEKLTLDRTDRYGGKSREWAYSVRKNLGGTQDLVTGYTIDTLIKKFNLPRVDLLKMDIEGAEKDVFGRNVDAWIGKVKVLCVELHKNYTVDSFDQFCKKHGFKYELHDGNYWAFRAAEHR